MRTFGALAVATLILAGCASGPADIPDNTTSTTTTALAAPAPVFNETTTSEEPIPVEQYGVPEWPAGLTWDVDMSFESNFDGEAYGSYTNEREISQTSYGAHDVDGDLYQVLSQTYDDEYTMMALVDDTYAWRNISPYSSLECRTEHACLDDPDLEDYLGYADSTPFDLFPVIAGRSEDVSGAVDGIWFEGRLEIGEAVALEIDAGTFDCFPEAVDLTAELTDPDTSESMEFTYHFVYHFCPELQYFGLIEAHYEADAEPAPYEGSMRQEVTSFTNDPKDGDLAALGRRFAEMQRPMYSAYTYSRYFDSGEDGTLEVALNPDRVLDQVHLVHTDPTGAIVAEGDGFTLDTSFEMAGRHHVRATVTGPQDVVMIDKVMGISVDAYADETFPCTPGVSGVPVVDGACDPLEFEAGPGLYYIFAYAEHTDTFLDGVLRLTDGDGNVLAEESAQGGFAYMFTILEGQDVAAGTWSLQMLPDASTGGEVEYYLSAYAWGYDDEELPLEPVPLATPAFGVPWVTVPLV